MYVNRVILANNSRLLMEMFHRVLDQSDHLEVVHEVMSNEELPFAIQRFCPEWVILSLPISDSLSNWIRTFIQDHSPVRFIFLSEDHRRITMKWQMFSEQDLSHISLPEFLSLLEKDLQHIHRLSD